MAERTLWIGGWWEDFVEQLRNHCALLSFNELNTLLIKNEDVINSRPLTGVSDDNRDLLPITPARLSIGRALKQLPDAEDDQLEEPSKRVMERYLYLRRLLNHCWRRGEASGRRRQRPFK